MRKRERQNTHDDVADSTQLAGETRKMGEALLETAHVDFTIYYTTKHESTRQFA